MLPVRIRCSNRSYVDREGRLWKADRYFSGGRIAERPDEIPAPGFGGFSSYRTGNFNYSIPVPDGRYQIRLLFAEPVFGRELSPDNGAGRRIFDIYCNGRTLASGLDIFREAGGAYRVIEKTLRNVTPDAQGKILLSFVPVKNYPVLLAIQVVDQTPLSLLAIGPPRAHVLLPGQHSTSAWAQTLPPAEQIQDASGTRDFDPLALQINEARGMGQMARPHHVTGIVDRTNTRNRQASHV